MWWSTSWLCFICRHNRKRTFRTYSLFTPYSLLPTPSFVVREARVCSLWQKPTRGQMQAEQVWWQNAETAEKEFRIEFSFRERALGET